MTFLIVGIHFSRRSVYGSKASLFCISAFHDFVFKQGWSNSCMDKIIKCNSHLLNALGHLQLSYPFNTYFLLNNYKKTSDQPLPSIHAMYSLAPALRVPEGSCPAEMKQGCYLKVPLLEHVSIKKQEWIKLGKSWFNVCPLIKFSTWSCSFAQESPKCVLDLSLCVSFACTIETTPIPYLRFPPEANEVCNRS